MSNRKNHPGKPPAQLSSKPNRGGGVSRGSSEPSSSRNNGGRGRGRKTVKKPPVLVKVSYKTSLCMRWTMSGSCYEGDNCQFAHGEHELRGIPNPLGDTDKPETSESSSDNQLSVPVPNNTENATDDTGASTSEPKELSPDLPKKSETSESNSSPPSSSNSQHSVPVLDNTAPDEPLTTADVNTGTPTSKPETSKSNLSSPSSSNSQTVLDNTTNTPTDTKVSVSKPKKPSPDLPEKAEFAHGENELHDPPNPLDNTKKQEMSESNYSTPSSSNSRRSVSELYDTDNTTPHTGVSTSKLNKPTPDVPKKPEAQFAHGEIELPDLPNPLENTKKQEMSESNYGTPSSSNSRRSVSELDDTENTTPHTGASTSKLNKPTPDVSKKLEFSHGENEMPDLPNLLDNTKKQEMNESNFSPPSSSNSRSSVSEHDNTENTTPHTGASTSNLNKPTPDVSKKAEMINSSSCPPSSSNSQCAVSVMFNAATDEPSTRAVVDTGASFLKSKEPSETTQLSKSNSSPLSSSNSQLNPSIMVDTANTAHGAGASTSKLQKPSPDLTKTPEMSKSDSSPPSSSNSQLTVSALGNTANARAPTSKPEESLPELPENAETSNTGASASMPNEALPDFPEFWSPMDDGITVELPGSSSTDPPPTRAEVDEHINRVLYGPRTRKRLSLFRDICPDE